MKTFGILLTCLLLIGMSSQAQNIYIRGGLGIAASTSASYNYTLSNSGGSPTLAASNKKGIGTGLPFVIAGGYKINENFAVELGIDYLYGFSLQSKSSGMSYSNESKWHGQMISIVPSFVMSLPLDKFKPYARLGLKLGVMNSIVTQRHDVYNLDSKATILDIEFKSKDYGGIAIGVQAAMGTDFVLSDLLSIFGEIQVDGISYSPKHGKYTEYAENGTDKLGTMSVNQKEWNYLKEIDYSKIIPDDQPDEQVIRNYHFGNVGLVLGVKINL